MKKQVYETPEMTVVQFDTADVITTSGICALAAGRGDSGGTLPGGPDPGDVSGGAASESGGCGLAGSDSGGSGCEGVAPSACYGGGSWNGGGCSDTTKASDRGCTSAMSSVS